MRCLFIFCLISFNGLAQWNSTTVGSGGTIPARPYNQFILDPYRHAFWFVNDIRATVIESDGTMLTFSHSELGTLWNGCYMHFAFTPNHIYYSRQQMGLYSFDNYTPQNVFSTQAYIERMTSDGDTVFFYDPGGGTIYRHDGSVTSPMYSYIGQHFITKGGKQYSHDGSLVWYANNFPVTTISSVDSDYLVSPTNTFSFQRYTDTLYVAQEAGITLIHEIDAFDTITPNNTINMPSSNVLDIAFDLNDSLWAVFGDSTGEAFALAKLEGTTWTNIYTSANSPIDFSTYRDLQFDWDNNIWVVDYFRLHTLENANSPSWLGIIEQDERAFSIFPNPLQGMFHIDISNSQDISEVVILDVLGKEVFRHPFTEEIHLDVQSGTYVITLMNASEIVGRKKIVIE